MLARASHHPDPAATKATSTDAAHHRRGVRADGGDGLRYARGRRTGPVIRRIENDPRLADRLKPLFHVALRDSA